MPNGHNFHMSQEVKCQLDKVTQSSQTYDEFPKILDRVDQSSQAHCEVADISGKVGTAKVMGKSTMATMTDQEHCNVAERKTRNMATQVFDGILVHEHEDQPADSSGLVSTGVQCDINTPAVAIDTSQTVMSGAVRKCYISTQVVDGQGHKISKAMLIDSGVTRSCLSSQLVKQVLYHLI